MQLWTPQRQELVETFVSRQPSHVLNEHAGSEGKCTAESAQLVAAEPEGCLVERHRRSQAGSRSGFIGGPTKDIATFEATATGTAMVALLVRRGAASPLQQQKVVRVSILPGQDS